MSGVLCAGSGWAGAGGVLDGGVPLIWTMAESLNNNNRQTDRHTGEWLGAGVRQGLGSPAG